MKEEGGRGGRGGMGNNNQPTVVICELIQTTTSYEYILLIPKLGLSVVATKLSPAGPSESCNNFLSQFPTHSPTHSILPEYCSNCVMQLHRSFDFVHSNFAVTY